MGTTGLVPKPKDGDPVSVRQAIVKLSKKLGPVSTPIFNGLTLGTGGLVIRDSDGNIVLYADVNEFYIVGVAPTVLVNGGPIGLLLSLTYAGL